MQQRKKHGIDKLIEQKKYGFTTDYEKLRAGVTKESCSKGGHITAQRKRNDRISIK